MGRWHTCFGPAIRQIIMAEGFHRPKLLISWWPGSREGGREKDTGEKALSLRACPQRLTSSTWTPPLNIFSVSPNAIKYESLHRLFHLWGQNPYNPISSPKVHLETLLPRDQYMPLRDISDLNHRIWSLHGRPVSLVIDGHCGDQEHSLPVQRHFTCRFVQNPC